MQMQPNKTRKHKNMTRKDKLRAKVDELFQCESFGYSVGKADVLELLQQVEREVLSRCQDKIESLMEAENESTDDQV